MTDDDQHLREKARLLLQRERELFDLRLKHEQLGTWLSVGQALPELFSNRGTLSQAWDGVRRTIVTKLRMQRVLVLELRAQEMEPLAPKGPARPITAAARQLLDKEASYTGFCNDPATDAGVGVADLAAALGLHRFMWSRIERSGDAPLLMVAGFDQSKAVFQSPFSAGDVANFSNAARQVQHLLGNAQLIAALELEKKQLSQANTALEERDVALRAAAQQLLEANESLERRVTERTRELASKNRELRLVLDTVDQALLTVDLMGQLAPERSSAADVWFGPYEGSPHFVDHIGADSRFSTLFRLGLDGLSEDELPRALCLDQMPKHLAQGARQFDCRYLPIEENGALKGLLLVLDDVTEQRARAREEAEQREALAAFTAYMRDRNGFLSFCQETERQLRQLELDGASSVIGKRTLHTLKGNAATFGLGRIVELCHQAESELLAESANSDALCSLQARWRDLAQTLKAVSPGDLRRAIEVTEADFELLTEQARQGATGTQIVAALARSRWEPAERPLRRLAQYAQALAERLGKGSLRVDVEADDTQLDPERWSPLWSALVHAVRNAVDHGIEPAGQRAAAGKPTHGRVTLSGRRCPDYQYQIVVEDDGQGIDWDAIRGQCRRQGRRSETHSDLVTALLSPDFSTRSVVTETSGRGVGLNALASAVYALAGQLSVESERSRGTRWLLTFPHA